MLLSHTILGPNDISFISFTCLRLSQLYLSTKKKCGSPK
uniref:Bm14236 n=1 Tax=Brugia malayi TaxID=6279 RepID=A0A0J9XY77_BRUMA|nr:Bm14236 [Brugia malayi]